MNVQRIIGVGPIGADAAVASAGKVRDFRNGRQLAAWIGLTLSQFGTGEQVKLGPISWRGDGCLRTLLIQGRGV